MLRRLPYPGLAAAIALAIVVGVPAATLFLPRTPPPSRPQPASVPIPPSPRPEKPIGPCRPDGPALVQAASRVPNAVNASRSARWPCRR